MTTEPSITARIDAGALSWLQIVVIVICVILNILDGFDITVIAYTAPAIAAEWRVPAAILGLVFSAGLAGMTIGAMLLAPLSDAVGRRRIIIAALVVIAAGMAASGWAGSIWELACCRLVTGLGIGSILASLTSLVAEFAPARRRNAAVALLQTGVPVGAMLGGLLAAGLIARAGWQALFFVGGALSAIMAVATLLLLPESLAFLSARQPRDALAAINRTLGRMRLPPLDVLPAPVPPQRLLPVATLFRAGRGGDTGLLWLAFGSCFFALYFITSWLPKIVADLGLPASAGIAAVVAYHGGTIAGILAIGWLADRYGLRRPITLALPIGAAAYLLFGLVPPRLVFLIAPAMAVGVFASGGFAALYSVAGRLYPVEVRSTGIGWAIGVGRFGGVIAPYAGGLAVGAQWSTQVLFCIFGLPLLIAAAAVARMRVLKVSA